MEKSNDKLATMAFKQGMYVLSLISQKLNKMKHDYATLIECFDISDNLTNWNEKIRRTTTHPDYPKKTNRRRANRDTPPPSLWQVLRGGRRDKQAPPKAKQYTAQSTTINNILNSIKDKSFLWRPKPFPKHLAKKNPNEHCSFHKSIGHATMGYECWGITLKNC